MNSVIYTGDGKTKTFRFGFSFFQPDDVIVETNGAPTTARYALQTAKPNPTADIPYTGGTVYFATAPANGARIKIYRHFVMERPCDFQPTGEIQTEQLNREFNFNLENMRDFRNTLGEFASKLDEIIKNGTPSVPTEPTEPTDPDTPTTPPVDTSEIEADITELQTQVSAITTQMSTFATTAQMTAAENDIATLDTRVDATEETITELDTRVSDISIPDINQIMPNYQNTQNVTLPYTANSSGWLFGHIYAIKETGSICVNNKQIIFVGSWSDSGQNFPFTIPLRAGDIVTKNGNTVDFLVFAPCAIC